MRELIRLDQMPYHAIPTVAVLTSRQFRLGWTWHLRALKLIPTPRPEATFFDNGCARGAVFATYAEAVAVADEFNRGVEGRVRNACDS